MEPKTKSVRFYCWILLNGVVKNAVITCHAGRAWTGFKTEIDKETFFYRLVNNHFDEMMSAYSPLAHRAFSANTACLSLHNTISKTVVYTARWRQRIILPTIRCMGWNVTDDEYYEFDEQNNAGRTYV